MQVRNGTGSHLFEVESETDPEKWYQVFANGTVIKCTCKGLWSAIIESPRRKWVTRKLLI